MGASALGALCGGLAWAAQAGHESHGMRAASQLVGLKAFEDELGVQAPVGYWDPLGLSKDGDVPTFKRRRTTELKHGRVAMLAAMGFIAPEYFRFPGYLSPSEKLAFEDVPNGLAALREVPLNGWLQIVLFAGLYELPTYNSDAEPGDLGWRAITSADPETRRKKLNAELANGRLAMAAVTGMLFQNGVTGTTGPEMWFGGAAAFEDELGVQAPLGFWDPAELLDGSEQGFRRYREVELKHGRVAMLATMGYMAPEFFRWPGKLAPSLGLSFSDMPNGLAALKVVPKDGWLQIFLFCGLVDWAYWRQDPARGPGDFANAGVLGVPRPGGPMRDAEARKIRLNKELANGRLAMVAFVGMAVQDGLTGTAWGSWELYTASPLRAFEDELGVQPPVGFWDPLGLSRDGDATVFNRRRATELKHGRLSMLAAMGYLTPEIMGHFPGYLSKSMSLTFEEVPNGLAALQEVPALGWAQIIGYCFLCELSSLREDHARDRPGDYGFRAITSEDPEKLKRKLNAELANGRLAMVAILGMLFQNGFTGTTGPGMWIPGAEAFEGELGVQAPVGFWDPLGLAADGDAADFRRRRVTELKHGRVSMLACLGYIVPEFFRWPGFCSPSERLAFADIPAGLGALAKLPGAGWVQIFLFCGAVESGLYEDDQSRAPGDYRNGGVLGVPNGSCLPAGEERARKLNAEIANGRLAMMAIMGMLFQDGLTGSAWGDWALYTDSPLRARGGDSGSAAATFDPVAQLGATEPLGFWDPCGFCKGQGREVFNRYRSAELKHARVAMLANVGFLLQPVIRFAGYEDVPDGLGALDTAPGSTGFATLFLLAGFFELRLLADAETEEPGNFGDPGQILRAGNGAYDEAWRNFELNNGRLAMIGAVGAIAASWWTGMDSLEQWNAAKSVAIDYIKTTIWWAK